MKVKCSENRAAWLMAEMGLVAKGARKFRVTTSSSRSEKRAKRIAANILARKFCAKGPNPRISLRHRAQATFCGFCRIKRDY